ncbi:MAG: hypothetical protein Q4F34_07625 [Prevotellaceae bacterium]|nr:hypothetical protein [Prevotellaceae bacterium]
MRRFLLLFALMCIGMANAQTAYTYVLQNGAALTVLGTAAFDVTSNPEITFVDGKAVMKIGTNTVAELPMAQGGELVVDFTTPSGEVNKVSKPVSDAGYATFYSPFQLQVPASGAVEVYAPTYDSENHVLKCNDGTKVNGEILPAGTGLLLKNAGSVDFAISAAAATAGQGDLSGSALTIPKSSVAVESGNAIYTLGHAKDDNTKFGFFKYSGTNLNAGVAYLIAPSASSAKEDAVMLSFGDDPSAIESIATTTMNVDGKFIENGRVVIMKAGHKFNVNGQEVK